MDDFTFDEEEGDEMTTTTHSPPMESEESNEEGGEMETSVNGEEQDDGLMTQLFGSDEEDDEEEKTHDDLHFDLPKIEGPNPENTLYYMKLGNTVNVAPGRYEGEVSNNDTLNTIRWRYNKDPETGEKIRESNARLVRWSDGSLQLYIGNKPIDLSDTENLEHLHLFVRIADSSYALSHGKLSRRLKAQSHEHARERLSKAMLSSRQRRDKQTRLTAQTEPELQDQLSRAELRTQRMRQRRMNSRVQGDVSMEEARGGQKRVMDDDESRERLQRARSGGGEVRRNAVVDYLEQDEEEEDFGSFIDDEDDE